MCIRDSVYNDKPTIQGTVPVIRDTSNKYFGLDLDSVFPVNIVKRANRLYVVVSGTRTLMNWAMNIAGSRMYTNVNDSEFPNLHNRVNNKASLTNFHVGYLSEINETYLILRNVIDMYYGSVDKLIFTGHSAGAPLASLYAYIYHFDMIDQEKKINIEYIITYASPRFVVDDVTGVNNFNEALPDYIRCFLTDDPVPYLPFKDYKLNRYSPVIIGDYDTEYVHIGTAFCLDSDLVRNDPNVLLDILLTKNKENIVELLLNEPSLVTSYLIQQMLDPEYLKLILMNFTDCVTTKKFKRNLTIDEINKLGNVIKYKAQTLKTYAEKCNLLRPMSIADRLQVEPLVTKHEEMNPKVREIKEMWENFSISLLATTGYTGMNLLVNQHMQGTYKEAVQKLVNLEAQGEGDILSIPKKFMQFKINKEQIREEVIKKNVVDAIKKQKDYIAIIRMDQDLKYNSLVEVYE